MTIGEVSRLLGIPVPTLRSWHLRYGVGVPDRTTGGHRRYGEPQVQALRAMNVAVARGVAPRDAAHTLRALVREPSPAVSLMLRALDRASACDQAGLLATLDEAEKRYGTEQAVDAVLIPVFREIGLRWESGAVDVGVEHLATSAVRRWIARRLGTTPAQSLAAPVLLAAAPGNEHTVALEAFGLLLDRRGRPVCLLGANTPTSSILVAARSVVAGAVVVTAHQLSRSRGAIETLFRLSDELDAKLYFAGAAFDNPRRRRGIPGTYLGVALPEAAEQVEADLRLAHGS